MVAPTMQDPDKFSQNSGSWYLYYESHNIKYFSEFVPVRYEKVPPVSTDAQIDSPLPRSQGNANDIPFKGLTPPAQCCRQGAASLPSPQSCLHATEHRSELKRPYLPGNCLPERSWALEDPTRLTYNLEALPNNRFERLGYEGQLFAFVQHALQALQVRGALLYASQSTWGRQCRARAIRQLHQAAQNRGLNSQGPLLRPSQGAVEQHSLDFAKQTRRFHRRRRVGT